MVRPARTPPEPPARTCVGNTASGAPVDTGLYAPHVPPRAPCSLPGVGTAMHSPQVPPRTLPAPTDQNASPPRTCAGAEQSSQLRPSHTPPELPARACLGAHPDTHIELAHTHARSVMLPQRRGSAPPPMAVQQDSRSSAQITGRIPRPPPPSRKGRASLAMRSPLAHSDNSLSPSPECSADDTPCTRSKNRPPPPPREGRRSLSVGPLTTEENSPPPLPATPPPPLPAILYAPQVAPTHPPPHMHPPVLPTEFPSLLVLHSPSPSPSPSPSSPSPSPSPSPSSPSPSSPSPVPPPKPVKLAKVPGSPPQTIANVTNEGETTSEVRHSDGSTDMGGRYEVVPQQHGRAFSTEFTPEMKRKSQLAELERHILDSTRQGRLSAEISSSCPHFDKSEEGTRDWFRKYKSGVRYSSPVLTPPATQPANATSNLNTLQASPPPAKHVPFVINKPPPPPEHNSTGENIDVEPPESRPFFRPSDVGGADEPSNKEPLSKEEQRRQSSFYVVMELHFTEKNYLKDIMVIKTVFEDPLRASGAVAEKDLYNIFSNIDDVIEANKKLLSKLDGMCTGLTLENYVPLPISSVFLNNEELCSAYRIYSSNQDVCRKTTKLLVESNPTFREYLELCKLNPECKQLDIQSFLIKPVQRICKYPLLLRELQKLMLPEESEFTLLDKAIVSIRAMLGKINEQISMCAKIEKAKTELLGSATAHSLDLDLLLENQTILREGKGYLVSKGKHLRDVYLVLVPNKLLIGAKPGKASSVTVVNLTPLHNCTLREEKNLQSPSVEGALVYASTLVSADEQYCLGFDEYVQKLLWLQDVQEQFAPTPVATTT
eukprot:TRINITY_DN210_c0_g4_i1.p1 TRINITY_DN210_c0_g4~~TRINITY_DN210_c0_g4_i1.p1  ORF type:complete len:877 (+),score=177.08 TRINITY_DN210_c0_g4_i1:143-2632(+)